MNTETATEVLYCERAVSIDEHGPVTFLTVLFPVSSGGILRCESHLFWEATEQHLPEITFLFRATPDDPRTLREALLRTHQCFADHRVHYSPSACSVVSYRLQSDLNLPFASWHAEGRFTRVLAALPDLTASHRVRDAVMHTATTPRHPVRFPRFPQF